MSAWSLLCLGLLPALAVTLVGALRGRSERRLAAMQMTSFLGAALLTAFTFIQGEPSFMDLPLALVLLGIPGSLLIASFYDRFL